MLSALVRSILVASSTHGLVPTETAAPATLPSPGDCFIQLHLSRQANLTAYSSTVPLMPQGTSAAKISAATSKGAVTSTPQSSFHEVVGVDGALIIALERLPRRSALAMQELSKAGITASLFPATDGTHASQQVLGQACPKTSSDPATCGKGGCKNAAIQGIAHSHQQALQKAMARQENWTAIFEDDAVPVLPAGVNWDAEFRKAWERIPVGVKIVRLGWCQPWWAAQMYREPTSVEGGHFQWMQLPTKHVGSCTHAYMVHKSIISSMLSAFPCCCAVDCCFEHGFFAKHDPGILANLIVVGGDQYIADHGGDERAVGPHMKWRGVIMQATSQLGHTYNRGSD